MRPGCTIAHHAYLLSQRRIRRFRQPLRAFRAIAGRQFQPLPFTAFTCMRFQIATIWRRLYSRFRAPSGAPPEVVGRQPTGPGTGAGLGIGLSPGRHRRVICIGRVIRTGPGFHRAGHRAGPSPSGPGARHQPPPQAGHRRASAFRQPGVRSTFAYQHRFRIASFRHLPAIPPGSGATGLPQALRPFATLPGLSLILLRPGPSILRYLRHLHPHSTLRIQAFPGNFRHCYFTALSLGLFYHRHSGPQAFAFGTGSGPAFAAGHSGRRQADGTSIAPSGQFRRGLFGPGIAPGRHHASPANCSHRPRIRAAFIALQVCQAPGTASCALLPHNALHQFILLLFTTSPLHSLLLPLRFSIPFTFNYYQFALSPTTFSTFATFTNYLPAFPGFHRFPLTASGLQFTDSLPISIPLPFNFDSISGSLA